MKNIRIIYLTAIVLAQLLVNGCHKELEKPKIVDVSLINVSSNSLDWVTLDWPGSYVPGGILDNTGYKSTAINVEWPNVSGAKLTFIDEKTRKPYSVDVSFDEVNKLIQSNSCHEVEIRILSYEKAEAICGKK